MAAPAITAPVTAQSASSVATCTQEQKTWMGRCIEAIDPRNIDMQAMKSNALHIALYVAEFIVNVVVRVATTAALVGLLATSIVYPISMIGTIPGMVGVVLLYLATLNFADRKFDESHYNVERLMNPQTQATA